MTSPPDLVPLQVAARELGVRGGATHLRQLLDEHRRVAAALGVRTIPRGRRPASALVDLELVRRFIARLAGLRTEEQT